MHFSANRNITNLYLIKVSAWFMLTMPIVVLFFQSNGLSMQEIFTLQSIHSIAMLVWEIPGGYLADVLGRKKSILLGSVLAFIAFSIYSFSYGFVFFVFAELFRGLGQSLIAGADSALLYDTLLATNRESEYTKYEGRTISIGNFAEAAAGITGGLLATISLRMPYYVQTIIAFVAIPASLALREAPIHTENIKPKLKDILKIIKNTLFDNRYLRLQILFSSVTGASTLTMAWLAQPYFKHIDLPVALYGITWTIINLSVGITSMYAYKIEYKYGSVKTVFWFSLILCISYFVMGLFSAFWVLGFLLLFYFARGLATPTLKNYINRATDSKSRATILSVRNFFIRMVFAILGPIYGWMIDVYSLSYAFILAGTVFTIGSAICFMYFRKSIMNDKKTY